MKAIRRVVAISDTHGLHEQVTLPEGDILLCCGDLTKFGRRKELTEFAKWADSFKFKHKVIIGGNHDFCLQNKYWQCMEILGQYNFKYLEDSGAVFSNVSVWGSPWNPIFGGWAFMLPEIQLISKFAQIPQSIDVLMTHCPPHNILDMFTGYPDHNDMRPYDHLGSAALRSKVNALPNLKAHVFGHIHEGYGQSGIFHNVAVCDINYEPVNAPTVFDVVV